MPTNIAPPVIVPTNAHLLTHPMSNSLRLLFATRWTPVPRHGRAGRPPDLRRHAPSHPIHEAFNQRLTGSLSSRPLTCRKPSATSNIRRTLGHKLVLTDDALQRVFEYTKGIPAPHQSGLHHRLMAGLIDQKSVLDESTIRKAIADIDHD